MKLVDAATKPPGKCLLTGDMDGPFIDTERWANHVDPYIYIHAPTVEEMARDLLGMVPKSEVDDLRQQLDDYRDQIERLQRFVDAQEALDEAAAGVG
jgi:hypothetical protein